MGVATVKATLVALFFMHLKYDEKFNQIFFVSTLVFLGIFVALTMADNAERGRVDPLEAREILLVPARPDAVQGTESGHGSDAGHGADTGHGEPAAGDSAHTEDGASDAGDHH